MANKPKKISGKESAKPISSSDTKITRITASDDSKKSKKIIETKAIATKTVSDKKPTVKKEKESRRNPITAAGRYFKGAWVELRQVRWPNRRATWGLTLAVLGFTAFFIILVVLLDAGFKYLFELILG